MPDSYFELAAFCQAYDICGFLKVARKRLLDEQMAAALECVHRHAIVGQVRREDAKRVGSLLIEQRAMIAEDVNRWSRRPTRRPGAQRLCPVGQRPRRAQVGIGAADDFDRVHGE